MKKNSCCECCGGSLKMLWKYYIKCEYCGQIYSVAEDDGLNLVSVEDVYQEALKLKTSCNREKLKEAASLFGSLGAYKDSDIQSKECFGDMRRIKIEEEENRLSQLRREEQKKIYRQKLVQQIKKVAFYCGTILAGMAVCMLIVFWVTSSYKKAREEKYAAALTEYETENYEEALRLFEELKDYNDALTYVADIQKLLEDSQKIYEESKVRYEVKEYGKALEGFGSIRFFGDSEAYIEQICDAIMQDARELLESEDYNSAKEMIALIPKDSEQYYAGISLGKEIEAAEKAAEEARQAAILLENYNKAIELYNANDYVSAQSMFMQLNGYEQSAEYLDMIGNALYDKAKALYDAGDYLACAEGVKNIDESAEWVNHMLVNDLLQKAKNDYANKVNEQALDILRKQGYSAFKEYITNMISDLYSHEDAKKMWDLYEPISLLNLETFADSGYIYVDTSYRNHCSWGDDHQFVDNFGNVYSYGMNYVVPNFSMSSSYIEYYVKDYNYLNGTIILNEYCKSEETAGRLVIYGDEQLIYTSSDVKKGFEPVYISIDISMYNVIRFEFEGWRSNVSLVEPTFSM